MKQCSKCKRVGLMVEFPENPNMKDGRGSHCKKCRADHAAHKRTEYRKAVRVLPLQKQCSSCRETKAAKEFTKNNSNRSGLSSQCKVCCAATQTVRRSKDSDLDKVVRRRYGVTLEELKATYTEQNERCAICKKPKAFRGGPGKSSIHIDHCHKTKLFRGLLCQGCNHGLGAFQDSIELLYSAIHYLEAHGK